MIPAHHHVSTVVIIMAELWLTSLLCCSLCSLLSCSSLGLCCTSDDYHAGAKVHGGGTDLCCMRATPAGTYDACGITRPLITMND